MNKLDNGMKNVERFVEHIGGFACFLLMMAVCWGVVERYFLKISVIQGLYNMIETYFFPVLVFTCIAGSYRAGLWPRLEVWIDSMPPRRARNINIVHEIIGIVMYLVVAYFTFIYAVNMTIDGREFQAGATTYPLWPFLWLVPLAFVLLSVEVFLTLWKLVVKKIDVARGILDK